MRCIVWEIFMSVWHYSVNDLVFWEETPHILVSEIKSYTISVHQISWKKIQYRKRWTQFIPSYPKISFFNIFFASSYPGASEVERRLHQKLFNNYNMKVRPARYWEEKVMVRVGMTLSQLVSLVGANLPIHNHVSDEARLVTIELLCHYPPHLSLNRTRRMKKWQPTFSWIWYGLTTGHFPASLRCSPCPISLLFSHHALKWTCHFPWAKKKRFPILLIHWVTRSCLCLARAN